MDMLGFLPGKLEQRAHPVIVAGKLRPGVINHVGQNEFFHQSEHGEIFMPPDLVERALLFGRQKRQLYLSQGLRHERLREIQTLLPPDDVFHPPVGPLGDFQSRLITIL